MITPWHEEWDQPDPHGVSGLLRLFLADLERGSFIIGYPLPSHSRILHPPHLFPGEFDLLLVERKVQRLSTAT